MFTLIVENENHETLELTNNDAYDVFKIDGLNPPTAGISTTEVVGLDGAVFNSSRVQQRNLVIYLNIKAPIEEHRQRLYRFFRVKHKCKIYFKNANRDVFIEGYVESFENDLFGNLQQPQISILCPEPFFKAIDDIIVEFSNTLALFEFPFAIEEKGIEFSRINALQTQYINVGDVEVGALITFKANADRVLNPVFYNRTTNEFFGVNVSMSEGDTVIINTIKGEKSVQLIHEGTSTNILSKRQTGSKWVQFIPGENEISYSADEGAESVTVSVAAVQKYEGV